MASKSILVVFAPTKKPARWANTGLIESVEVIVTEVQTKNKPVYMINPPYICKTLLLVTK